MRGLMTLMVVVGCSGTKGVAPAPQPGSPPPAATAPTAPAPVPVESPTTKAAKEAGEWIERAFTALTVDSLVVGDAKQLATVAWAALGLPSAELPTANVGAALRARTQQAIATTALDIARVWAAIDAMAYAVDDAHVALFTPDMAKQIGDSVGGLPFVIAGAMAHRTPSDELVVSEVFEDSPAKTSGLAVGDVIVSVDGRPPRRAAPLFVIAFQPEGSKRSVVVKRATRNVTVELVLRSWAHPVGNHRILKDGTGVVRLYFCGLGKEATRNHIEITRAALAEMKSKNVKRVVIDMRGNMGGGKPADVASLFVAATPILMSRARQDTEDYPWPRNGDVAWTKPLAVLVDEQTISCGEMIPFALQEHGRARLFGQPTSGALNVPDPVSLGDHLLFVPVAEVFGPKSKKAPARYRVTPDEVVPNRTVAQLAAREDPQLDAAIRWLAKQTP